MKQIVSQSIAQKFFSSRASNLHNYYQKQQLGEYNCSKNYIDYIQSETQQVSFGSSKKNNIHLSNSSWQQKYNSSPVQLFTKLKQQKYKRRQEKKTQNSFKSILKLIKEKAEEKQNAKNSQPNMRASQIQYMQKKEILSLNQEQLSQLQILKLQKVNHIVNEHFTKGRNLKQILANDIIGTLKQQIQMILTQNSAQQQINRHFEAEVHNKNRNQLNFLSQKIHQNYLKPDKYNLQSTAQYWERSDQKLLQQDNSNNKKYKFQEKKQIKQFKITVNYIQSTIKNLQSPQYSHQRESLQSGIVNQNRCFQTQEKSKICNKNRVNIVEFTLGQSPEGNSYENFAKRKNQDNIIDAINNFSITSKSANNFDDLRMKNKEDSFNQVNITLANKQKQEAETRYETGRVLAFNRRRLPKGKAIKNKVMGGNNTSQDLIINS